MKYAATTEVSADRSRTEIERTLSRYGARAFMYAWDESSNKALVSFQIGGRFYKIAVPLPPKEDFRYTPERGKLRSAQAQQAAWEQATRQRWRAMALGIKAILEWAESGIVSLEILLLAFTLLPDEQTVGDWLEPQLKEAYLSGKMPRFLPMLEHKET